MLDNHRWPGLVIDQGLVRSYPFREYTAHPLGYVGSVSEKDLKNSDAPLLQVPGFKIGKSGFEKTYDESLRGTEGSLKYLSLIHIFPPPDAFFSQHFILPIPSSDTSSSQHLILSAPPSGISFFRHLSSTVPLISRFLI